MTINGIDLVDFLTAMLATGLLRAVPLVLASMGDVFAQKSGLLNLGIEGMMLSGCFFGFYAAYHTESVTYGLLAGMAAGLAMAMLFAVLTVSLRVDQVLVAWNRVMMRGSVRQYVAASLMWTAADRKSGVSAARVLSGNGQYEELVS